MVSDSCYFCVVRHDRGICVRENCRSLWKVSPHVRFFLMIYMTFVVKLLAVVLFYFPSLSKSVRFMEDLFYSVGLCCKNESLCIEILTYFLLVAFNTIGEGHCHDEFHVYLKLNIPTMIVHFQHCKSNKIWPF